MPEPPINWGNYDTIPVVSSRIVPDQDPKEVFEQLKAVLTKDPPWGVHVKIKPAGAVSWWMIDPRGPAFAAAMSSLEAGFGKPAVSIGCGGSIGFVGPLAELFGGAPALLLGIEDPRSNAHAPNESLPEEDWKALMRSMVHLFDKIGAIPGGEGKVKFLAKCTMNHGKRPTSFDDKGSFA